MRRLLAIALLLAATDASANQGYASAWNRVYTSAPADASPNSSAPSAANTFENQSYYYCGSNDQGAITKTACVATMGLALYLVHDGTGGNVSCTVTPWVRDGASARWYSLASVTGVESYEGFENVTVGPADVFFQVASCGAVTYSADHPLTIYAGPK